MRIFALGILIVASYRRAADGALTASEGAGTAA